MGTMTDYDGVIYATTLANIEIANFEIQMNSEGYPSNKGIYLAEVNCHDSLINPVDAFELYSGECKDCIIERLIVKNFPALGIRHEGNISRNIIIEDCIVIGTGTNHRIQNIGGAIHKILNYYGENCKLFAFNFKSVGGGVIDGNITVNTYAEGINIDNSNECIITNNYCTWDDLQGTDFGISIYGDSSSTEKALNNIIIETLLNKSKKSGIALADDVSGNMIANNIIYNANQLNEAQGAGILLYGAVSVNSIIVNIIRDDSSFTKYGINEYDDPSFATNPDYSYISNNQIINYATSHISLQANHSKKTDS